MKKFVSIVFWFIAVSETIVARELQVSLDLKEGEPKNGAFCSEAEKHQIVKDIAVVLSGQRNRDPATFLPDHEQWCQSLCTPSGIRFCKLLQAECKVGKTMEQERRHLLDKEDFEIDLLDLEYGEGMFLDDDVEDDDEEMMQSRPHVRRLNDEELTTVEMNACKAEKKILMKKLSVALKGTVQRTCMKFMRQKLRLACGMF